MEAESAPSVHYSFRPHTNEPFPRRLPVLPRERGVIEQRQADIVPTSHLLEKVEGFLAQYAGQVSPSGRTTRLP